MHRTRITLLFWGEYELAINWNNFKIVGQTSYFNPHWLHFNTIVCRAVYALNPWEVNKLYIDGLVQDCSISIALAMEILQSCTDSSIPDIDMIFSLMLLSNLALPVMKQKHSRKQCHTMVHHALAPGRQQLRYWPCFLKMKPHYMGFGMGISLELPMIHRCLIWQSHFM